MDPDGGLDDDHPERKRRNYKLLVDPFLKKGQQKLYRFEGVLPGDPTPVKVADPRSRVMRLWTKQKQADLEVPPFKIDEWYVGNVPPKEVTFANLNDNINQDFLANMCKVCGVVVEAKIFTHPGTKKHLGIGKVIFDTTKAARMCAEKLDQVSKMGMIMTVFVDPGGTRRQQLIDEKVLGKPQLLAQAGGAGCVQSSSMDDGTAAVAAAGHAIAAVGRQPSRGPISDELSVADEYARPDDTSADFGTRAPSSGPAHAAVDHSAAASATQSEWLLKSCSSSSLGSLVASRKASQTSSAAPFNELPPIADGSAADKGLRHLHRLNSLPSRRSDSDVDVAGAAGSHLDELTFGHPADHRRGGSSVVDAHRHQTARGSSTTGEVCSTATAVRDRGHEHTDSRGRHWERHRDGWDAHAGAGRTMTSDDRGDCPRDAYTRRAIGGDRRPESSDDGDWRRRPEQQHDRGRRDEAVDGASSGRRGELRPDWGGIGKSHGSRNGSDPVAASCGGSGSSSTTRARHRAGTESPAGRSESSLGEAPAADPTTAGRASITGRSDGPSAVTVSHESCGSGGLDLDSRIQLLLTQGRDLGSASLSTGLSPLAIPSTDDEQQVHMPSPAALRGAGTQQYGSLPVGGLQPGTATPSSSGAAAATASSAAAVGGSEPGGGGGDSTSMILSDDEMSLDSDTGDDAATHILSAPAVHSDMMNHIVGSPLTIEQRKRLALDVTCPLPPIAPAAADSGAMAFAGPPFFNRHVPPPPAPPSAALMQGPPLPPSLLSTSVLSSAAAPLPPGVPRPPPPPLPMSTPVPPPLPPGLPPLPPAMPPLLSGSALPHQPPPPGLAMSSVLAAPPPPTQQHPPPPMLSGQHVMLPPPPQPGPPAPGQLPPLPPGLQPPAPPSSASMLAPQLLLQPPPPSSSSPAVVPPPQHVGLPSPLGLGPPPLPPPPMQGLQPAMRGGPLPPHPPPLPPPPPPPPPGPSVLGSGAALPPASMTVPPPLVLHHGHPGVGILQRPGLSAVLPPGLAPARHHLSAGGGVPPLLPHLMPSACLSSMPPRIRLSAPPMPPLHPGFEAFGAAPRPTYAYSPSSGVGAGHYPGTEYGGGSAAGRDGGYGLPPDHGLPTDESGESVEFVNAVNSTLFHVIEELKTVIANDIGKRLIQTSFKHYDDWWSRSEQLAKQKVAVELERKEQAADATPTTAAAADRKPLTQPPSSIASVSSTLSVLFDRDRDTSFRNPFNNAGSFLGLRAGIAKMPSFRRKTARPPPTTTAEEQFPVHTGGDTSTVAEAEDKLPQKKHGKKETVAAKGKERNKEEGELASDAESAIETSSDDESFSERDHPSDESYEPPRSGASDEDEDSSDESSSDAGASSESAESDNDVAAAERRSERSSSPAISTATDEEDEETEHDRFKAKRRFDDRGSSRVDEVELSRKRGGTRSPSSPASKRSRRSSSTTTEASLDGLQSSATGAEFDAVSSESAPAGAFTGLTADSTEDRRGRKRRAAHTSLPSSKRSRRSSSSAATSLAGSRSATPVNREDDASAMSAAAAAASSADEDDTRDDRDTNHETNHVATANVDDLSAVSSPGRTKDAVPDTASGAERWRARAAGEEPCADGTWTAARGHDAAESIVQSATVELQTSSPLQDVGGAQPSDVSAMAACIGDRLSRWQFPVELSDHLYCRPPSENLQLPAATASSSSLPTTISAVTKSKPAPEKLKTGADTTAKSKAKGSRELASILDAAFSYSKTSSTTSAAVFSAASGPSASASARRPRDETAERRILYDIFTSGVDAEDMAYLKHSYEQMLTRDDEAYFWCNETHWVDHPLTYVGNSTSDGSASTDRHRRLPDDAATGSKSRTGSARTDGYRKLAAKDKRAAAQLMRRSEGGLFTFDDSVRGGAVSADSKRASAIMASREARSNQRRLAVALADYDVGELLKLNQLKFRRKSLYFARSAIHDWGLFAHESIAADDMVVEYVGQLVRPSVADLRERRYEVDGIGSSYLFRIDNETIIDATKCGNVARFMNHCCDPNCYAKVITVEGQKKIVIYSRREIGVHEEITYDYKFPYEEQKIKCNCGARNCRGTLN